LADSRGQSPRPALHAIRQFGGNFLSRRAGQYQAKSHLCIAIAYRAIQHGYEARFVGADALIGELSRAASKVARRFAQRTHPHQQPTRSGFPLVLAWTQQAGR